MSEPKNMIEQLSDVVKDADDFREMMEKKYEGDPQEVKKLVIDLLCLIYVEFYVRPGFKDGG
jgi:hypothetical protein